jgi:hypothetical protein
MMQSLRMPLFWLWVASLVVLSHCVTDTEKKIELDVLNWFAKTANVSDIAKVHSEELQTFLDRLNQGLQVKKLQNVSELLPEIKNALVMVEDGEKNVSVDDVVDLQQIEEKALQEEAGVIGGEDPADDELPFQLQADVGQVDELPTTTTTTAPVKTPEDAVSPVSSDNGHARRLFHFHERVNVDRTLKRLEKDVRDTRKKLRVVKRSQSNSGLSAK